MEYVEISHKPNKEEYMTDRKRIIRVNRLLLIVALAQLPLAAIMVVYIMITYQSMNALTLIILSQATILVPTLLYLLCFKEEDRNIISVKGIGVVSILIVILLGFMIQPLISLMNLVSMLFTTNEVSSTMDAVYDMSLGIKLFAIAFLPAIGEELLFRGFIYGSYKKKGTYKALIVSALLFGLLHMNLNQFIYTTILGVFLALLLEATGSIIAPMIVHFVFNGTSVIINHFTSSTGEVVYTAEVIMESIVSVIPTAIIATAIAVGLFWFLAKQNNSLEHIKNIFRNRHATPGNYTNPVFRSDINSAVTFRGGNTKGYKHDDTVTYLNGEPYYGEEESGYRAFSYIKPFHSNDYSQSEYGNNSANYKMNGHTHNNRGIAQMSAPIATYSASGQSQKPGAQSTAGWPKTGGVSPMMQQVRSQSVPLSSPISMADKNEKKVNSLLTPSLIIFILFCLCSILSSILITQLGLY